jgi:FAD/FMN-containing dehydrogenase
MTPPLSELEGIIDGDIIGPEGPKYRDLRRPFNARFDDVIPQAVVRCASEGDVAETIAFIRRHDLRSATRSGGHCFAGRSTTPGILIDVSSMRSVTVRDGLVRIGAGAVLGEVYSATIPHALTIPGGTCPSVGIAGLTLGGGLGLLGRTYGLTSDRLVGARIALPDGRTVACDEHHEGDLFWALRGAGTGHFGVVSDLTFHPVPTPATTNLRLVWPFSDAAKVATAWMGWSPAAPDAMSASLLVGAGPDPDLDPALEVVGAFLGSASDARELLDGLVRDVGSDPDSAVVEELSYEETMRSWAARAGERLEEPRATPEGRAIHLIRSEFFARPIPLDAITALFERLAGGRVHGQARGVDFSPWGGAYNRVAASETAFVHRDARFWVKHEAAVGADASDEAVAATRTWVDASWNEVHPFGTGGVFPNFADPDLQDWGRAYHGSNFERLCQIKSRYDPDNVFRFRQSLPTSPSR